MRKPHKIAYLEQRENPQVVMCVQATTTRTYASDADECGSVAVSHWQMVSANITNGMVRGQEYQYSGNDAESFWDALHNFQHASELLIVSVGAREHCAALGLWDHLLTGRYVVRGYDPLATRGCDGYIVLESPPTIVLFSSGTTGRHYTWVDPRNYGARFPFETLQTEGATPDACGTVAREVLAWFAQYLAMLNAAGLGKLAHTAAGQAAAGYRRQYMDHPIYVHDNEAVLNLERAALCGGRNECGFVGLITAGEPPDEPPSQEQIPNWQAGLYDDPQPPPPDDALPPPRAVLPHAGKIVQLDFNGLYPSVACDAMLPTKLLGVVKNPSVKTLLEACKATPVIATIRLRTQAPCVPVWVDRNFRTDAPRSATRQVVGGDRQRYRMVFPTGDFNAVLCGPEITLAAQLGTIQSCGMMAAYEGRPIYRNWVYELYVIRQAMAKRGWHHVADCVKAIMNASFAKWAQLNRRWVDEPKEVCPWPWDQWYREDTDSGHLLQWRAFAWAVQRLEVGGEPGDSMPAITAYINSLGRVKLWEALSVLGSEEVFYYDTDSIWTTEFGVKAARDYGLIDPTTLGKLKVVGEYSAVELFGLKRYFADGRLTIAGADGSTVRTSDAWALAMRAPPTHSYLRMHRPPGIDKRTARMRLSLPYRHGILQPNGWVEPLSVYD